MKTRKLLALQGRIERELPRCREFVSKLWDIPERQFNPKKIAIDLDSYPFDDECPAASKVEAKEIIFYNFQYPISSSVERILVHELTHLAITSKLTGGTFFDNLCLGEGFAQLAEKEYHGELPLWRKIILSQRRLLDSVIQYTANIINSRFCSTTPLNVTKTTGVIVVNISPHPQGYSFIKSLSGLSLPPKELLRLLEIHPPIKDEIFFPYSYVDRVLNRTGATALRPSHAEMAKDWINEAVDIAKYECDNTVKPLRSVTKKIKYAYRAVLNFVNPIIHYPFNAIRLLLVDIAGHIIHSAQSHLGDNSLESILARKLPFPESMFPKHLLPGLDSRFRFVDHVIEKLGPDGIRTIVENPPKDLDHIIFPDNYLDYVPDNYQGYEKSKTQSS